MKRGGKRAGSGRKSGSVNRLTALKDSAAVLKEIKGNAARKAVTAAAILCAIDEMGEWLGLVKDPKTKFAAMCYLTDRRDGKAKQALEHSGPDGGVIPLAVTVDL